MSGRRASASFFRPSSVSPPHGAQPQRRQSTLTVIPSVPVFPELDPSSSEAESEDRESGDEEAIMTLEHHVVNVQVHVSGEPAHSSFTDSADTTHMQEQVRGCVWCKLF